MRKSALTAFFTAFLAALIIFCCSEPKKAHASADDPSLGGCIVCAERNPDNSCKVCTWSAHPTIVQPLAAIDLKTSTLLYGISAVSPGLCYGVTYAPSQWYASGANFCLNVGKTNTGNTVFPSGVVSFVKWGVIGLGGLCSDGYSIDGAKLACHALLMFGANVALE